MASGVQVALAVRLQQSRKKTAKGQQQQQHPLPSNVATKHIKPFPTFPPTPWNSPRRAQAAWDGYSLEYQGSVAESVCGVSSVADSRAGANVQHRMRAHKAHKKWMRKHRIRDLLDSPSGSPVARSGSMDALLWVGLVILMAGTVTSFVGLGEKGFRSPELRLVGPILSGFGLALCVVRLVFCCFGNPKARSPTKTEKEQADIRKELVNTVRLQHVISLQGARPKIRDEPHTRTVKKYPAATSLESGSVDREKYVRPSSPVGSSRTNSQQTITAVIETPRDADPQTGSRTHQSKSPAGSELLLTAQQLHSK